jgi:hypothetical protein
MVESLCHRGDAREYDGIGPSVKNRGHNPARTEKMTPAHGLDGKETTGAVSFIYLVMPDKFPHRDTEKGHGMKKVVSGGPRRAIAFPQADAGLPDTIPLN